MRGVRFAVLKSLVAVAAFSVGVLVSTNAAAEGPATFLGSPADGIKQQEVQSATVYPQQGATSGRMAGELNRQRDTPRVLATMQQKHDAVVAATVYPQEGATSGMRSVENRARLSLPRPLRTTREKQDAVDAVTKANAGA